MYCTRLTLLNHKESSEKALMQLRSGQLHIDVKLTNQFFFLCAFLGTCPPACWNGSLSRTQPMPNFPWYRFMTFFFWSLITGAD